MSEADSADGISRREVLGGAGATLVAVLAGVGGYFVKDGSDGKEIRYPSQESEGDGSDGDEEMERFAEK